MAVQASPGCAGDVLDGNLEPEVAMTGHTEVLDLLGAWALDSCDEAETAAVERHLLDCASCSEQARELRSTVSWLGYETAQAPPPGLRQTTLARAFAARPPVPLLRTLVDAYAGQVARLDQVLDVVRPEDWTRPDPRHGDVRGLLAHLAGNDAALATDLRIALDAVPVGPGRSIRRTWRATADAVVDGLAVPLAWDASHGLDRPVRLAGSGPPVVRPLRDALVQRAFETWIHRDDLGLAFGFAATSPPPEQVRRIVDLAVALLPDALRDNGIRWPGEAARLALTGPGGGDWTFPLGHHGPTERVAVVVHTDAEEFCRLVANRRHPAQLLFTADGDQALAVDLLRVAVKLGCD
jgi:uncharacterized protein (TIGR03083 family)